MTPPPRLVPDRPSDAVTMDEIEQHAGHLNWCADKLREYGFRVAANSIDETASLLRRIRPAAAPPAEAPAVDHGMSCADMEVAYDCSQQVIADQKARIERLESLLFAEQTKLAPGYPTPEMLRAAVECRYGPATYKCVSAAGTSAYEQEAADDYAAMLAAAPPAEAPGDKGPWKIAAGSRDVYSGDFVADVALRISGDFEDEMHRIRYAEWLCETLNRAAAPTAPAEGGAVARVIFTNRKKPDVEWLTDTVTRDTLLYTAPRVTGGREVGADELIGENAKREAGAALQAATGGGDHG